jgi:DnaJ-class molecular chaperone
LKSVGGFTVAENEENQQVKKICEVCEGSGQICEFRGVSRFVLSWDDCPVCGGMGFLLLEKDANGSTSKEAKK